MWRCIIKSWEGRKELHDIVSVADGGISLSHEVCDIGCELVGGEIIHCDSIG